MLRPRPLPAALFLLWTLSCAVSSLAANEYPAPEEAQRETGAKLLDPVEFYHHVTSPPASPLGPVRRARASAVGSFPTLSWEFIGPRPVRTQPSEGAHELSGRVTDIATHPTNPNIVYVASAGGGLWKTVDGGITWIPLTDNLPNLSSGAVAVVSGNPNRIYYATGEHNFMSDCFPGDGLFRSDDGGATWAKIGTAAVVGNYCSRLVVRGGAADTIFVASDLGVVRSTDGGLNWSRSAPAPYGCSDLVFASTESNVGYALFIHSGIYKTSDHGVSWARLTTGLPASGFSTGKLAISRLNPAVVLASLVNTNDGTLFGIYVTTTAGAFWSLKPAPEFLNGQGSYDNCATIDPTTIGNFLVGGCRGETRILKSPDFGSSWSNSGAGVHDDIHVLTWGPTGELWVGCDGGVWKSLDQGASWINRNTNLETIQFYTVAAHPSDPAHALGGTQDNGSMRFDGTDNWTQTGGNDGGPCAFEWDSPEIYYTSTFGGIDKWDGPSYLGAATGGWLAQGDRADAFNCILMTDPNHPNTLYFGTYRLWKTTNSGGSWAAVTPDLTNGTGGLLALAITPQGRLYTTSNDGAVCFSADGLSWVKRNAGLPATAYPDISVDPSDYRSAYVECLVGSGPRVFRTTNAGVSWQDITGDLPEGEYPRAMVVDFRPVPRRLYLGTYLGVYSSDDEGAHWRKETGHPNVPVINMALDPANDYLYTATHGRGMLRAKVPVTSVYCRVNCGGPALASGDGGPPWSGDLAGLPSQYVNAAGTGNTTGGTVASIDVSSPTIPLGTPAALFQDERHDFLGGDEMEWTVPAPIGPAQLRLYFAEIFGGITGPGLRLFDVDVNGGEVLHDYDVWAHHTLNRGYVETVNLVSHGSTMTIRFRHAVEHPFISGLEVVALNDGITSVPPAQRHSAMRLRVASNPFRDRLSLEYTLREAQPVRLEVIDVSGRLVATLVNERLPAGRGSRIWNGTRSDGAPAAPGVYLCRLSAGGEHIAKRVVLIR
jgi:photosystem II stability/assembly factor-like uncharacterized protein